MIIYRVEASFSLLDKFGEKEITNAGPYMWRNEVIRVVRNTFYMSSHLDERKDPCNINSYMFRDDFNSGSDRHPAPDVRQHRALWSSMNSYACGFSTLEKLDNWFDEQDLRVLDLARFVIMQYEIDDRYVISNQHQDVFMMKESKCIGFTPIMELYA